MNKSVVNLSVLTLGMVCVASSFGAQHINVKHYHAPEKKDSFYVKPEAGYSNFQLTKKLSKALRGSETVDADQLKNALSSSSPTAGVSIGKYFGNFGLEAGYSTMKSNEAAKLVPTKLANDAINPSVDFAHVKEYLSVQRRVNNFNLDANYTFDVAPKFKLVPSAGLGYMHTNLGFSHNLSNIDKKTASDLKHFVKNNSHDVQPRAGLSGVYNLTEHVSLTAGGNYQAANSFYKGVTTVKAGFEVRS